MIKLRLGPPQTREVVVINYKKNRFSKHGSEKVDGNFVVDDILIVDNFFIYISKR